MAKRGRPCKNSRRDGKITIRLTDNGRITIRLTDNEMDLLDFMCEETGKSKTDILIEALRTKENLMRYRNFSSDEC